MNSTDWAAATNSEIFREYVSSELKKEALSKKSAEEELDADISLLQDLEGFERKVNASPRLKKAFKKLQHAFTNDPEYTAKVDPKFVESVMLINLEEQE